MEEKHHNLNNFCRDGINHKKPFFIPEGSYRRDNEKLRIALRLKGYREFSAFARDCNFSRSFISKVVHRLIQPTIDQAQQIAEALGLKVNDIFDNSDLRIQQLDFLLKKEEDEK